MQDFWREIKRYSFPTTQKSSELSRTHSRSTEESTATTSHLIPQSFHQSNRNSIAQLPPFFLRRKVYRHPTMASNGKFNRCVVSTAPCCLRLRSSSCHPMPSRPVTFVEPRQRSFCEWPDDQRLIVACAALAARSALRPPRGRHAESPTTARGEDYCSCVLRCSS